MSSLSSVDFQPPTQRSLLLQDLKESLRNWSFWTHLAWEDVAKQYRRSFLGPVWITLNTALFVIAFGLMGAQIFKMDVNDYLPYLCAGHVLFLFMSGLLTDGCQTYIAAEAFLKQSYVPKVAFALRVVLRNLFMLLHNLPVLLLVLLWSGLFWRVNWFAWLGALVVALWGASMLTAVLGIVCARFRDVPMIVTSMIQIAFFITPVMWKPSQLTPRAQLLVDGNPLAAFLDTLRAPLLGQAASTTSWTVVSISLIAILLIFVPTLLFTRRKIVYWL